MIKLRALLLMSGVMVAAPSFAQVALEPYQLVRSFQRIQDQIIAGDKAALSMQKSLFQEIATGLRQASENAPSDDRNLRAVLMFALSGGGRNSLRPYRDAFSQNERMAALATKVFNYNGSNAALAFNDVDVERLENLLGSSIALIRGQARLEPVARLRDLNFARINAPGTLIEEGALRRLAEVYRQQDDADNFYIVSRRYINTYIGSPFAGQFVEQFIIGAVALDSDETRPKLRAALDMLEENLAFRVRDRIIRVATIGKKKELFESLTKTQDMMALQRETNAYDAIVLRAYNSINSLNPQSAQTVLAELEGINAEDLSVENRRLRQVTITALNAIYGQVTATTRLPELDAAVPLNTMPDPLEEMEEIASEGLTQDDIEAAAQDSEFIQTIREQLENTDKLLENLDD